MSKTPGFKRVFILTAEVFPGEQGIVEEQSNGRRCSPSTGAELLAGSPGLSLNSALILSKSMGPPHITRTNVVCAKPQAPQRGFWQAPPLEG